MKNIQKFLRGEVPLGGERLERKRLAVSILAPNQCIRSVGPFDGDDGGGARCWDRIPGNCHWLAIVSLSDTCTCRTESHSWAVCDCDGDDDGRMPQNYSHRRHTVGQWIGS